MVRLLLLLAAATAACARPSPVTAPPPAGQNPSPMVERTRLHARLDTATPAGLRLTIAGLVERPVVVFVPELASGDSAWLLVHAHGAAYPAMNAAAQAPVPVVLASVHLGAGSGVYERAFRDSSLLPRLRQAVGDSLAARLPRAPHLGPTAMSAFSAGYGAVRAVLRQAPDELQAVLLLDGLHAAYVPPRTPLAEGGALDSAALAPFIAYARRAAGGGARLLITHSEIFPGTFASTTETADHLLAALGLARSPVLAWGPVGMQQLADARAGGLRVMGFAGNTAPDHVDHLHGMPRFLGVLLDPGAP